MDGLRCPWHARYTGNRDLSKRTKETYLSGQKRPIKATVTLLHRKFNQTLTHPALDLGCGLISLVQISLVPISRVHCRVRRVQDPPVMDLFPIQVSLSPSLSLSLLSLFLSLSLSHARAHCVRAHNLSSSARCLLACLPRNVRVVVGNR